MNNLQVFVNQFKAGELWLDEQGRFCFRYCKARLNAPYAQRLSVSLPLREDPFKKRMFRPHYRFKKNAQIISL